MDRSTVLFCLRCSGAAASMIVPLLILRNTGLFVKLGAGAAAYLASSLTIRTVSRTSFINAIRELRANKDNGRVPGVAE